MDKKKGETKAKERMKKEKLKLKNEKDLFFFTYPETMSVECKLFRSAIRAGG